jgi:hypothetical protein
MDEGSRARHGISLAAPKGAHYNFCSGAYGSLTDAAETALRRMH